jgi:hypothetical protein
LTLVVAAHASMDRSSEPFYNVDETRNVMTGVFFHDLAVDHPIQRPVGYTIDYYLQYPALGLLLWPPFFHAVLGSVMLVFGTSVAVAKGVILVFSLVSCDYFFRLVRHTHGVTTALVASAILGVSPMMFEFSRQVMLEVPTLASVMASVYYFVMYLDRGRRRDLYLACFASALAVLTRFDGAQLALIFLMLCLAKRRAEVLWSRDFIVGSIIALAMTVPVYALILTQVGGVHSRNISAGFNEEATSPFHPRNFAAYAVGIPAQMGWFAAVPALIGLFACARPAERKTSIPYLAMFFSTYLMIAAVAEILDRHAIYWGPPLAFFCARGLALVTNWLRIPRLSPYLASSVLVGTIWATTLTPVQYVFGYEEAARYVVENTTRSRYCLFDRYMNGNFIYQVRRHDPDRRLWVLRADKLLYSTLIDPENAYREFVEDEAGLLRTLDEYGPEFIIVEKPQLGPHLPMAARLRFALQDHPERFQLTASFPIRSNIPTFFQGKIQVYRDTTVIDGGKKPIQIFSQTLGRSLGTVSAPTMAPGSVAP